MVLSESEIKFLMSLMEGKESLPEDVREASEKTLLHLAGFMQEHGGWSNFAIATDEFLSIFLFGHPMVEFAYLATYPQYAFPLGYDEFRWATPTQVYGKAYLDNLWGTENIELQEFSKLSLPHFRRRDSGIWDFLYPDVGFGNPDPELAIKTIGRDYQKLVIKLKTYKTVAEPTTIVLPELWTPNAGIQQIELVDSARDILLTLYQEKKALANIHWRTLEEIVAELLRARGLSIHITPRSDDGGRDIIARGELLPGEPSILAVEVKQKPVVKINDLRSALWANKSFPVLMFATSGRFSAGVIKEKDKADNLFRLVLKDGIALKQWIDAYGCDKGWPK